MSGESFVITAGELIERNGLMSAYRPRVDSGSTMQKSFFRRPQFVVVMALVVLFFACDIGGGFALLAVKDGRRRSLEPPLAEQTER